MLLTKVIVLSAAGSHSIVFSNHTVYDNGTIFDPEVLDITDNEIQAKFLSHTLDLASLCLAVNYPCMASVPHMLAGAAKKVLGVAVVADINFPAADKMRDLLNDPSKLAALAGPATAAPAAAAAAKVEEKKEESEEEDEDMSLSLFD